MHPEADSILDNLLENNLALKKELIKKFTAKKEVDFEGLINFIDEFQKIGGVPKKDTVSTMKNFEAAVKNGMEKNKFTDEQRHQIQKAIKSSLLNNSSDPDKAFMQEKSRISKLIDKALKMDGTITGEHGIGLQKKEYLLRQHPDNIPLMKLIKKSFDPNNILNPGKIFDI